MTQNLGGQEPYVPLPTQEQVQRRHSGEAVTTPGSTVSTPASAPVRASSTPVDPRAAAQVRTAWSHTPPSYQPAVDHAATGKSSSRRGLRWWVLTGLAALGFGLGGLGLAAYIGASFGVQTALIMLLVACIPLGIVIPTFLWLDRFEAEPTKYLLLAFFWGAIVAAVGALIFNTGALLILSESRNMDTAQQLTATVVAPVVEEAAKGLLVLLLWRLMRREFDGLTDGMVYAGICAAGFAFTENITYLGSAYQEGAFTATFIMRCLLSPFAHPMFTICTGIGIGIAATSSRRIVRFVAPITGFVVAAFAHALWNLSALTGGGAVPLIYLFVDVPIFLAFVGLVIWARRNEGRLIGQFLSPYAQAGWLAPAEVAMLSSMPRRREARIWARANAGRGGLASMRAFQDTASELALLRRRMYHTTADQGTLAEERRLLDALVANRRGFVGMPMA